MKQNELEWIIKELRDLKNDTKENIQMIWEKLSDDKTALQKGINDNKTAIHKLDKEQTDRVHSIEKTVQRNSTYHTVIISIVMVVVTFFGPMIRERMKAEQPPPPEVERKK